MNIGIIDYEDLIQTNNNNIILETFNYYKNYVLINPDDILKFENIMSEIDDYPVGFLF